MKHPLPIHAGPMRAEKHPDDLRRTLGVMLAMIERDSSDPRWIAFARRLVGSELLSARTNDERENRIIHAVFRWVKQRVAYVNDPVDFRRSGNLEVVADGEALLGHMGAGDCDEHVVLVGTLLAALGLPIEVTVCGPPARGPIHVYTVAVKSNGARVAVDTTLDETMGGHEPGTVPGTPEWKHWKWEAR